MAHLQVPAVARACCQGTRLCTVRVRSPPIDRMSAVSVKPPLFCNRKSRSARVAWLRVPAQLPAVQRQNGASRTASKAYVSF
jgi:hypothetical protein